MVDGLPIAGFEAAVGPYDAIVDGDALVYSIACASVVAKVVRDRLMARLAARYPGYGWEPNAGYATAEHRAALRILGVTPTIAVVSRRSARRWRASSSFDLQLDEPGGIPSGDPGVRARSVVPGQVRPYPPNRIAESCGPGSKIDAVVSGRQRVPSGG